MYRSAASKSTVGIVRPNLVILTAQQLHTAASLLEMAEVLYRERVPVAFGGLVFTEVPDLHQSIPGYYLGGKLEQAVPAVEQIMASLRPLPAQRLVGYDYKEAVEQFRARQTLIESEVWQQMQQFMPKRHLATANQSFGRAIIAALSLGDVNYLDPDIDWIEGLLVNHNEMPPEALDAYLEIYLRRLGQASGQVGLPGDRMDGAPARQGPAQRHSADAAATPPAERQPHASS